MDGYITGKKELEDEINLLTDLFNEYRSDERQSTFWINQYNKSHMDTALKIFDQLFPQKK